VEGPVTRRLVLAAVGALALVLAVPLVLLGRAALATPAAVARQTQPASVSVGPAHRSLAEKAAWNLLGADRGEAFAQIVQTYRTVAALPALAGQATWSVRIAGLIPKLRSPEERAQAYVMAGRVLALGAGDGLGVSEPNDSAGARALLAQAADDFRAALRNDPGSEEAKYDLELLIRQQLARAERRSDTAKRSATARSQPAAGRRQQAQPLTQSRINDAGVYASGSGY
jgi:hypothetical protein